MAKKCSANCKCKDCPNCKGCTKAKKETVKESAQILGFIKCMTEKNFAQANKYLQSAVMGKLKEKIQQCANIKPF